VGRIKVTDFVVTIGGVDVSDLVQGITFDSRFTLDEAEARIAAAGHDAPVMRVRDDG
jgi:hypothetical protein